MRLAGVLPPVVTPFRHDDLDLAAFRANARKWMATRVAGLVVLGTNGESAYVDDEEAEALVGAAREEVPRNRLLIAGTGRDATRAAVKASVAAARQGADLVLVRPPAFFRTQMNVEAMARHYTALADACPVPVLLYNFSAAFGVEIPVGAVERLVAHPNIAGIKESGSDVARIAEIAAVAAAARPEFAIFCGAAPVLYPSVIVGATGGILALACAVPDLCVDLYELARAGRHDEARALQRRLTPLARFVTTEYGVPGLKAALDLVGFTGGEPRAPLAPAPAVGVAAIRAELQQLGVLSVPSTALGAP